MSAKGQELRSITKTYNIVSNDNEIMIQFYNIFSEEMRNKFKDNIFSLIILFKKCCQMFKLEITN